VKSWTIGKRIFVGFAAVLLILAALGIFAHLRLSVIRQDAKDISGDIPSLEAVAGLREGVKDNLILVYKHIYSSSPEDMGRMEAQLKAQGEANTKTIEAYEQKAASKEVRELIAQVESCRENYRKLRAEILVASRAATNAEASAKIYLRARSELEPLIALYTDALNKLWELNKQETEASSAMITAETSYTNFWMTIGLGIALALGLGLAFIITRGISVVLRRVSASLGDGSQQVASAAGQVSSSSQSLAEGASEQAASIEETSSSLEEMASMTQRNAENAQKANDLAKQARAAADKGAGDMQTMSAAMEAIKVSSDDIAKIIKTIDEIAFQTNILALNAAVEAARAGESGAGFAVVADEVRNLAQRSAQAAKETADKIEGAIGNTAQGVEISKKVAETLNEIVVKARQVDELVAEVTSASREQTQGITQINTAVGQMDKVTQGNAASAEECAAAAEELNAQAETMKHSVGELLQLVGGQNQADANQTVPAPSHAKPVHPNTPKGTRTVSAASNGHAHALPKLAGKNNGNHRNEIPMAGDFKDF
jgi:methyl-accepting chemotaxis protein